MNLMQIRSFADVYIHQYFNFNLKIIIETNILDYL